MDEAQQVACYVSATVDCMMSVNMLLTDITCVCVDGYNSVLQCHPMAKVLMCLLLAQ